MAPFRFNQKDLNVLATQSSEKFHKEGLLWFKAKEGKFNKSEVFTERFFRLYGNLLFYFKGKDQNTECSGVIILENFSLVPDSSSSRKFSFNIEFEKGDEQKYELAACSVDDFNEWTKVIKSASYERLRKHLEELRKDIVAITGEDPLPDQVVDSDEFVSPNPTVDAISHEDVLMEMCLTCKNLSSEGQSNLSAMIKVFTVIPPETEWMQHSRTEISEEGDCPIFLRTIVLSKKHSAMTRLKFVIYNVTNKSKSDVTVIGQCVCTIQEVQSSKNWQLSLSIKNVDTTVGWLIVQGWERETRHPFRERRMTVNSDPLQQIDIRPYVTNIIQRSFHVPKKDGGDLKFQEFLAESLLCFKIPKLLLGLFVAEEKESVMELHNMGQLHPEWNKMQGTAVNSHFDLVHQYSSSLADILQYEEERSFKKSVDKSKKDMEFIPTNLHLQRECIVEKNNEEFYYDVVTVGAPTAISMKYKHGGLRRMMKTCKETARKNSDEDEKRKTRYQTASNLRDVLKQAREEILAILKNCNTIIEQQNRMYLREIVVLLSSKIAQLMSHQNSPFVQEADKLLLQARTLGPSLRVDRTIISTDIDDPSYKELVWEWTGTDFKASKTATDHGNADNFCGVADAFSEFTSAVNASTEDFKNQNDLLVKVLGLEKCVTSLIRKINVLMRFILMQEETEFVGMKDIRYRKDVVFSQALTPVVTGFTMILAQKIGDQFFLKQLAQTGLLVHFESLLTTHGDEMGMLEDMIIGVQDLSNVSFKIVCSEQEIFPVVRGKRSKVTVEIPVKLKFFKTLPESLQKEPIAVHPLLFSVGINEQATLAEKFGDTSLQEFVNSENFYLLEEYFKSFNKYAPDHVGSRSPQATPIPTLMDNLKTAIHAKKYKDVEIFALTEEICWRLNALRLTCCKSAKDRSSMSVTLEMVRTLVREHGMAEGLFTSVLDSLRSQGTRLINAQKNVGIPKYAFNIVQVRALPTLYKPPEGTTGKSIQT